MEGIWRDLRYCIRSLRKTSGFTAIVVTVLTLGIGANTAIFSVVNAVILQQLPYRSPENLVMARATHWPNFMGAEVAVANFLDLRREYRSFEALGAYGPVSVNIVGEGTPERVQAAMITTGGMATLGVEPLLGRLFHLDEENSDSRVAILSYGLWRNRFAGDPNIIGKVIRLSGFEFPVIGVMPPQFQFPTTDVPNVQIWIPIRMTEARARDREERWLYLFGRLKEGVSLQAAQQETDTLMTALAQEHPQVNKDWGLQLSPMHEHVAGNIRPALLILMTTALLVLFLACLNIATLQMVRTAKRKTEVAIRSAMGAPASAIVRQLLFEGLTLALLGGLFGVLLAHWSLRLLVAWGPQYIPRVGEIGIDARVLLFALGVCVLTGVIFGLVPAFSALKPNLVADLQEGRAGTSSGRGHLRFRRLLTVVEVAAAFVLLLGASLLVSSLTRLLRVEPGFNPKDVLTMELVLPLGRYGQPERATFWRVLTERAAALPGVEAVGGVSNLPLSGSNTTTSYIVLDRPPEDPDKLPEAGYRGVTPGYFGTMQIDLVQGRDFSLRDTAEAPRVVIVNQTFANLHWPGENPVGKQIYIMGLGGGRIPNEVIGVIDDIHHTKLDVPTVPEIYVCFEQRAPWDNMVLVVRTKSSIAELAPQLSEVVAGIDPEQPVFNIKMMDRVLAESTSEPRLYTVILGAFASLALILSTLGIYSIISYSVAQRQHELGIRVALGAKRSNVLTLVAREGILVAASGIAAGLLVSWLASRGLASLLFGVQPNDPMIYLLTTLLFGSVVLTASLIPALRASKVSPMIAFRT